MARNAAWLFALAAWLAAAVTPALCPAQTEAPLPSGIKAVWGLDKAWHEKTPTRERVCLNGLWQWQPAAGGADAVPADRWGWFKVPGSWPGITDYMQKDCQTVYTHPSWKDAKLSGVTAAWYQRELTVPADWAGRRITLSADYVNSYAGIYVDGKKAGEIRFPGGEADLSAALRPGAKHVLSLLLEAMPLKGVMLSYNDTNAARQVKGSVARRGLCGDVYLVGAPAAARIADVKVDTSVRKGELTLDAALEGLAADGRYILRAKVASKGFGPDDLASKPFTAADLKNGRFTFTSKWKTEKLWDLHTPQNQCQVGLTLEDAGGKALDTALAVRFGFREFWIDGRDFYLNGTRIFLSSVPVDNAAIGAAWATYDGAKESLKRLQGIGINMVYTHNYGCEPGDHLGFEEILRAADDVGMLVSFSQPHFGHYDWKAPDADQANGYARHAEYYVRAAGNHPAVVFYSMSHNSTGYNEDMNPDLIDGIKEPRTDSWSLNNAKLALRAESIVHRLDPGRIVYHHSSGNLSSMHTSNFYPNFAPIQEMDDWFEHWATVGVKPMFTCEYGAPITWDWSMYRGWYKGQRSFGSAQVPWEFCFAEWSAQFLGDRAFQLCDPEKANLRWEAKQFRAGKLWHRWDYPFEIGSPVFDDRHTILGMYTAANWRAFRTWGLSANSPWEYGHFWRMRPGMNRNARQDLKVDWENLQRPGFSPDYVQERYERMDLAYEPADWVATADGQALLRNNMPLLAYIGGKPAAFTSKDHLFLAGETVEKQIIVINNSRETVTCKCDWGIAFFDDGAGPSPLPRETNQGKKAPGAKVVGTWGGGSPLEIGTGQQVRQSLRIELPADIECGKYGLKATFKFSTGETQEDKFTISVLPHAPELKIAGVQKIALFDPKGETAKWLAAAQLPCKNVEAGADLAAFDMLIVGKAALTVDGPGPDVGRVRDGLKVIVFEQAPDVLEKRFGFRIAEYGLRQVFKRLADHPALAGLDVEHLRDWRGDATILPPRLKYETSNNRFNGASTVKWCDIEVTRVWRCGCRGNVASVLIEKPARGDFLPILDGGYSLQYSPLMEYREGKGLVLFCQMDVTGRSEADPAAERLACNIVDYVSAWKPAPVRKAVYAGDPAGKAWLEKAGVAAGAYEGGKPAADQVLVAGSCSGQKAGVGDWLKAGGRVLAIGVDEDGAKAVLPGIAMKKAEHIATFFEPFAAGSPLAGVGPADVHNRDPHDVFLVTGGAKVAGDGVLAEGGGAVVCQMVPWEFDYAKQYNLKRTFRRSSFLVARLLANLGVAAETPVLDRFKSPVSAAKPEKRWLDGLYLDQPEEMDDPYRFFRW